jgi:hypothetical protein
LVGIFSNIWIDTQCILICNVWKVNDGACSSCHQFCHKQIASNALGDKHLDHSFSLPCFLFLILWYWDFEQFSQKLSEFIQVSNTQLEKKLGFWWLTTFFNLLSKFSKYWIKKTPTLLNFPTLCHLFCSLCVCVSQS